MPQWTQTAAIYARGYLSHDAGVPLESVEWVQSGVNQAGRIEKMKPKLPDGLKYRSVPDRSLTDMLLAGDIDAVLSARPPHALGRGVRRLFENYEQVEEAYFRKTGIFPIMHVLAVKTDVLARYPWLAMNLYKAFDEAKRRSMARFEDITASYAPFAWLRPYSDRMKALFGQDFWPYGLEPNRKTLDTLGINGEHLVLGVDRLDYTKGILERFKAVEFLLDTHPEYVKKLTLLQIASPTREMIEKYREYAARVTEEAERINKKFGTKDWKPITLEKRNYSHDELINLYQLADVCLVTSLHDGMNLVAKEFAAARNDESGVLVLSQFAGASRDLKGAILINPYSAEETSSALHAALIMPKAEQHRRMKTMRASVRDYNIYRWSAELIKALALIG